MARGDALGLIRMLCKIFVSIGSQYPEWWALGPREALCEFLELLLIEAENYVRHRQR